MNRDGLDTPVLFVVFNRVTLTKITFARIRDSKPKRLFIAADGPRKGNAEDVEKCKATREAVLSMIDWECEVNTLFREENLGCGLAVSGAINWFFEHVEEGIILEDDCLPESSFFPFCEGLLKHYRHSGDVMHIGGNNFQNGLKWGDGSYYFSAYGHIWGWATWRRAWRFYNYNLASRNPLKIEQHLREKYGFNADSIQVWIKKLMNLSLKEIDTWDYQWQYSIWTERGLCIIPNVNLVRNLGFDETATHTKDASADLSLLKSENLDALHFLDEGEIVKEADEITFSKYYNMGTPPSLMGKIRTSIRALIR